jgi:Amino acid:DNA transferase
MATSESTATDAEPERSNKTVSYEKLDIFPFGKQLLESKDIDPIYVILNRAELGPELKARWCVAYWCLYHPGVASYIAQAATHDEFWLRLGGAARNSPKNPPPVGDRWPRGKERRHWRGQNALDSQTDLVTRYFARAGKFIDLAMHHREYKGLANFVESHRGFGPWMSFKVADMMEQCWGHPVEFQGAEVFMFKDPKEAALMLWRRVTGHEPTVKVKDPEAAIAHMVRYLQVNLGHLEAPNGKRKVGLQEIETVLCKWKSHQRGHYPLNNDLRDIRSQLAEWASVSSLAAQMERLVPPCFE